MARSILFLLFSLIFIAGTTTAVVVPPSQFIKSSCTATTYPALCIRELSVYSSTIKNSQEQLVLTALTLSESRTKSAQTYLKQLKTARGLSHRMYEAIDDCLEEVSDSYDRLSKSTQEMKGLGKSKGHSFAFHLSNVQTWVSSALTDESTCEDGFAGRGMDGKIKTSVRGRITNVAQVTSTALALINNYAKKH